MSAPARRIGRILMVSGAVAFLVGLAAYSGWLSWFGRLPGDIHIRGERTTVFVPITSMLLVSVAVTLVLWAMRRL